MADKIKVKDVVKGEGTCQHYHVTFDMGDETEFIDTQYGIQDESTFTWREEQEFLQNWIKFQFKYKADKMKLKGKVVIEVTPMSLIARAVNYAKSLLAPKDPELDRANPLGLGE